MGTLQPIFRHLEGREFRHLSLDQKMVYLHALLDDLWHRVADSHRLKREAHEAISETGRASFFRWP